MYGRRTLTSAIEFPRDGFRWRWWELKKYRSMIYALGRKRTWTPIFGRYKCSYMDIRGICRKQTPAAGKTSRVSAWRFNARDDSSDAFACMEMWWYEQRTSIDYLFADGKHFFFFLHVQIFLVSLCSGYQWSGSDVDSCWCGKQFFLSYSHQHRPSTHTAKKKQKKKHVYISAFSGSHECGKAI